jgi:hypothetical protein
MLLIGCLRLLVLNGDPKHQMSALGHKRKWCHARGMSVLSLKADIASARVARPLCAISGHHVGSFGNPPRIRLVGRPAAASLAPATSIAVASGFYQTSKKSGLSLSRPRQASRSRRCPLITRAASPSGWATRSSVLSARNGALTIQCPLTS